MSDLPGIFLGNGTAKQTLCFKYANRHGLIAGANRDREDRIPAGSRGRLLRRGRAVSSWPM
jgi:hypothetical protein